MAANLPFKIGDAVYDSSKRKGTVIDFKPLDVSDPSNGQFLYKVLWESSKEAWLETTQIHKESFFHALLSRFK